MGGVPILYDRRPPSNYGVGGIAYRPYIEEDFGKECETCFSDMFETLDSDFGLETVAILTGGVSRRPTSGRRSYHHQSRAFDLDGLLFEQGNRWVADTFPTDPYIYLAIESVVRRQFGTVLAYDYNATHEDHIHFDNGTSPGFNTMAKSRIQFVQNCSVYLFDQVISVDGVYGPDTRDAISDIREELSLGTFTEIDNWQAFLEIVPAIAGDRSRQAQSILVASGG
ncbi:extensin family protein [uncultured Roseobacter sp.]|uniref:extensin family protein n=1 Tax=uncultured Roseobacter sp. TaxID=114847 RepID=UPI00260FDC4D|nr:extensin family protein [uncultured Roseobacter sp.]